MDALGRAIADASVGKPHALHALLARGSGLPGPRANLDLADRFARACAASGPAGEKAALGLARLDADLAPGATALEFLPVCGALALGACAAADPKALPRLLPILEEAASDLRWRVRSIVPVALARVGAVQGEALLEEVASWMDGFFPAAAVLVAAADPAWLSRIERPGALAARIEEAFTLVRDAERSLERYPGYKALVEALGTAPAAAAARFGAPILELLARMSDVKEPVLRDAIAKNLDAPRLARRYAFDVARVRAALAATAPVPRDPRHDVGPTRRRGKKRRR